MPPLNPKNYGLAIAGTSTALGVRNVTQIALIKKELKQLNNRSEAKKIYRDSGSQKPFNTWLSERKSYLQGQLKSTRYSNVGVVGGVGLGLANAYNNSAYYPTRSSNFYNTKAGGIATNATLAGAGLAGSAYSFKKIVDCRKEINNLKKLDTAKKLYKSSGSKESFNTWRDKQIKDLKKLSRQYTLANVASIGTAGLGAYSLYSNLSKNETVELTEAFYGKANLLKRLEDDLWGKLIYAVSHDINPYTFKKDIQKAEKELAEFFNIEKLRIHIGSNYGTKNAFTLSWFNTSSDFIDKDYETIETSEGIKFKSSKDKIINVYIYPSLLDGSLTKEELMAVFLHEIGHNFFVRKEYIRYLETSRFLDVFLEITFAYLLDHSENAFTVYIQNLRNVCAAMLLQKLTILGIPTKQKDLLFRILNWLTNPGSYDIVGDKLNIDLTVLNKIVGALREILGTGMQVINIATMPLRLVLKFIILNLVKALFKKVGSMGILTLDYQAEKFADAFAAKFGYGKDLYTGLEALGNDPMNGADILGGLTKIYALFESYAGLYFIDCHPSNITRCQKLLALYKKELSENGNKLTSKQKEEIKYQIKHMEKLMKASKDKTLLKRIEIKLDKPYSMVNDTMHNKLSGIDGTYA